MAVPWAPPGQRAPVGGGFATEREEREEGGREEEEKMSEFFLFSPFLSKKTVSLTVATGSAGARPVEGVGPERAGRADRVSDLGFRARGLRPAAALADGERERQRGQRRRDVDERRRR